MNSSSEFSVIEFIIFSSNLCFFNLRNLSILKVIHFVFSSKCFEIVPITFKSLKHLQLIFVSDLNINPNLCFLHG